MAIVALLLLGTRTARSDVLWKGDFETGDLSQWSSELNLKTGQRTNITVVGSPVEQGKHAAQLVVHPDDLWPNGHDRVELHEDGIRTGEGQITFFSWYFQLPVDVTVHEDIGYWETWDPFQQAMAFYVDAIQTGGTRLGFRTNWPTTKEHWSGRISVGGWHQIAMKIVWSADVTRGKVSVWLDGVPVVDDVTTQTKPNAASLFVQVGFHRDQAETSVDTIFIDGAVEGTALEDVLMRPAFDAGPGSSAADAAGESSATAIESGVDTGVLLRDAPASPPDGDTVTRGSVDAGGPPSREIAPAPSAAPDSTGCGCRIEKQRSNGGDGMMFLLGLGAAARRKTGRQRVRSLRVSTHDHRPPIC